MGIKVTFNCGGCFKSIDGTSYLRPNDRVLWSATSGDMMAYTNLCDVTTVAPTGWVPFDPYTRATYCPECWAGIVAPKSEAAKEGA
jgi:hypothetical protein